MEALQVIVLVSCSLVIVIVASEWWSLRRILAKSKEWPSIESKFIAESLISLRSGQKIFASTLTIAIVALTFFGYNELQKIKKDVTSNVVDSVNVKLNIDVDALKRKAESVNAIAVEASQSIETIKNQAIKAKASYDQIIRNPQRLYVTEGMHLSPNSKVKYSDLRIVGGYSLPSRFEIPPVVLVGSSRDSSGTSIGIDVRSTREYVEIDLSDQAIVTLLIYLR